MSLAKELRHLDAALDEFTKRTGYRLLAQFGVGPQTAATLLVTAVDNPDRLRSEAALAALYGVSPLEASSGRSDPRTHAYVARRTAEGLSTKEIQRCLKRYIVRELYPLILADLADAARPNLT